MSILSTAGKDAGESAAKELHSAIDGAIPEAQAAADELVSRIAREIVTQASGAITQAFGSMEIALGGLPESIVTALDGLTIEVSPITVKLTRAK